MVINQCLQYKMGWFGSHQCCGKKFPVIYTSTGYTHISTYIFVHVSAGDDNVRTFNNIFLVNFLNIKALLWCQSEQKKKEKRLGFVCFICVYVFEVRSACSQPNLQSKYVKYLHFKYRRARIVCGFYSWYGVFIWAPIVEKTNLKKRLLMCRFIMWFAAYDLLHLLGKKTLDVVWYVICISSKSWYHLCHI